MYYEINVSLKGKHIFATAKRSITHSRQIGPILDRLEIAFPAEEGYELMTTRIEKHCLTYKDPREPCE